jgi:hypothetical protein
MGHLRGTYGKHEKSIINALLKNASSDDHRLRSGAAIAIAEFGKDAVYVLPRIEELRAKEENEMCQHALDVAIQSLSRDE